MATTTINVNASFTGLSDTPSSYTGQAGKAVFVKLDESGLEFGTAGGGDNLFTANLTLGANRTHDMNGNSMTFLKSKVEFRSAGNLSTDKPLIIRNQANTANGFEYNGDGTYRLGDFSGSALSNSFTTLADGRLFMAKTGTNFIELNPSGQNRMYNLGGWQFDTSDGATSFFMTGGRVHLYKSTIQLNINVPQDTGGATLAFLTENGTAPSVNKSDMHWYYSADVAAGNAAPHFRTENGNVIKLYQQSSAGITTVGDIVTVLQNLGLLS
jgi:hypothetical protein